MYLKRPIIYARRSNEFVVESFAALFNHLSMINHEKITVNQSHRVYILHFDGFLRQHTSKWIRWDIRISYASRPNVYFSDHFSSSDIISRYPSRQKGLSTIIMCTIKRFLVLKNQFLTSSWTTSRFKSGLNRLWIHFKTSQLNQFTDSENVCELFVLYIIVCINTL